MSSRQPRRAANLATFVSAVALAFVACAGPSPGQGPDAQANPQPPSPPTQAPDMNPPTGLTVAVSGTSVVLSWDPPSPPAEGYNLVAGPAPDALSFVTSSLPAGASYDIAHLLARGGSYYVALQATRKRGSEYSATSVPIQVTYPTLDPATLLVECTVGHVTAGRYWSGNALQGPFTAGSCVAGAFHGWDMGADLSRIYGATYGSGYAEPVLDLGVVDGRPREDSQDGPFPSIQLVLSPMRMVTTGSTWTNWAAPIAVALDPDASVQSLPVQVFGAIYGTEYGGGLCLDGVATAGSLTVVVASGLDPAGGGEFRIQGTVTFADPVGIGEVCERFHCCTSL